MAIYDELKKRKPSKRVAEAGDTAYRGLSRAAQALGLKDDPKNKLAKEKAKMIAEAKALRKKRKSKVKRKNMMASNGYGDERDS